MKLQTPKLEGFYIPMTPKKEQTSLGTLKMYYKESCNNTNNEKCNKNKLLSNYHCEHLNCNNCLLYFGNIDELKKYLDDWDNYYKTLKENNEKFLKEKIEKANKILQEQ